MSLGLEPLRAAGETVRAEVDAQVSNDEETAAAIRALEERHDAFLTEDGGALPTGEELGQAFERFLAEHSRENRDDDQLSF